MKTEMIKPGYKKTELGWIPNEWQVKKIKEFGQVYTGNTPSTQDQSYYGNDYLFVSPGDLGKTKYIYDTNNKLSKKGFGISRQFPKNSVLVTCIGSTIGKIGIAFKELTSNQQINAIVCNNYHNYDFLFYELVRNIDRIRNLAGNQAVPILNKSSFETIHILCPPLPEQKKIAEILSTWDKAIESTEKLIEAKTKLKQGLMQKLFSTVEWNKRGIEWKEERLNLLGETYNGLTGKNAEHFGSGKPYIPYLNIFKNYRIDKNFFNYVQISENEVQSKIQYGDFFFTVSSETPDDVGMSSVLLDDIDEAYLNSFCFGYRLYSFESILPEFASFYLRSQVFRREVIKLAQGSTRFNLSKSELTKIKINLPDLATQKKIAELLRSFDKQIELLNILLDALKEQKKGLMQKLLTGEVRVKI